jgi:hypothetical protein
MKLANGLVAVLLLPLVVQDAEVSAEDEHRRLIEYVEDLDEFTLRYSVSLPEGGPGEVWIVYSAPDRAAVFLVHPRITVRVWAIGGVTTLLKGGDDEVVYAEVDIGSALAEFRDVRVELHDAFGVGEASSNEVRPVLHVHSEETPEGQAELSVNVLLTEGGSPFFCWNGDHKPGDGSIDGGHLVLHSSDLSETLRIARTGAFEGFPETIVLKGSGGAMTLRLDGIELEADEDDFEIPEPPDGASDVSEEWAKLFAARTGPAATRHMIYERIQRSIEEGDADWDDDTRELARGVFEALHRHRFPAQYEETVVMQREAIRAIAESVAHGLERDDVDKDQLAGVVAERKGTLTANLKQGEDTDAESLSPAAEGEWVEVLLGLERDVSRTLFREAVTDPLIEEFETEVEGLF